MLWKAAKYAVIGSFAHANTLNHFLSGAVIPQVGVRRS